jgi:hypothetical protein
MPRYRSWVCLSGFCEEISCLQSVKIRSLGTYGDGLDIRVEDTTVEEGCTGVGDEDGLGTEDEDGLGEDDEDGRGGGDEEVGLGVDDAVGEGVGVGVGVEVGVGRTVTVVFLVVVVVVVYPFVTVAVAVPERRMLLQNSAASDVCPSNASNPQSPTRDDVRLP